ncbi:hypothetical protein G7067_01195 [Leucobacter insecticola]|uniref:Uncharacterized protein n=1 Tax=Leucobacter insecticola TaxID=2714934 RepID=A0A6G8FG23_9MICO|nr:hypothetical protein [Leucobacter insecticola]QIM15341.1 hypothetical protein G7067_01195 [Leucobacter insecticola]
MSSDTPTTLGTEHGKPGKRSPEFWGRAALTCFLAVLFIGGVLAQSGIHELEPWAGLSGPIGYFGYFGGIVLAVVSLIRREPRGLAIATLVLAGILLATVALIWAALWWMITSQPPCEGGPFCFNPA